VPSGCWCWNSGIRYPPAHAITSCSNETRSTAVARNSPLSFVYLLSVRRILTCVDRFKNRPVAAANRTRIRKHYSTGAWRGPDRACVVSLSPFGLSFCEVVLIDSHSFWAAMVERSGRGAVSGRTRQLPPRQAATGTPLPRAPAPSTDNRSATAGWRSADRDRSAVRPIA